MGATLDVAAVLGLLAGVVGIADTVPYVRDILRGRTRPHRGTWLIWGVLAGVVTLSQWADGGSWSLVMAGTQAVATAVICGLSVRRGEGGLGTVERIMMAVAGCGVAGWLVADEPIVATACVVAADLIGVALMLPKTYRDPDSETLSLFVLATLGGALATASVGALDASLLLYPLYFCAANGGIAALIVWRRRSHRLAAALVARPAAS